MLIIDTTQYCNNLDSGRNCERLKCDYRISAAYTADLSRLQTKFLLLNFRFILKYIIDSE